MNTQTNDPNGPDTPEADLTPTRLFGIFAHPRRQYTLEYLSSTIGAVAIDDLAEFIALREAQTTHDHNERILTGLGHVHLPTLADAGLIQFDLDRETVELVIDPIDIATYVALSKSAVTTP